MTRNQPSAKSGISDRVYNAIKVQILRLVSEINEPVWLREEEVAQQLGVSRTPVREAFQRLGYEGILSLRPRKGALLMPVTRDEYLDWLKLRAQLEAFAAHEAALNSTMYDVESLRNIFRSFDESTVHSKMDEYAVANVEFHSRLIKLARNSSLVKVWESFGHRAMIKSRSIERLDRAILSLREHLALIDAIESRNATLAAELACSHVNGLYTQVLRMTPRTDDNMDKALLTSSYASENLMDDNGNNYF